MNLMENLTLCGKLKRYEIHLEGIEKAKKGITVDFRCQDVLKGDIKGTYDFEYDSGMFHHIPPHRRITYIELIKSILKPCGYFGLVCFA